MNNTAKEAIRMFEDGWREAYHKGCDKVDEAIVPALLQRSEAYKRMAENFRAFVERKSHRDVPPIEHEALRLLLRWADFVEREGRWLNGVCLNISPERSPQ